MIKLARARLRIGLQVIIRPRGGDFLYSPTEFLVMQEDIQAAKALGADGVVVGCLTPVGDIDRERLRAMIQLARPMNVTFHRAFDMCREPKRALEDLVELGVDRVLTSGQEATCLEGQELLAELQQLAKDRILVLAGGGLTTRNVRRIVQATGVTEVHLSARSSIESQMQFRNTRCFMGGTLRPPEFSWKTTDESAVRAVVAVLQR
jgi:copper homeostasis protein